MAGKREALSDRARAAKTQGHCRVHRNRFSVLDEWKRGTGRCRACQEEAGIKGLAEMRPFAESKLA